MEYSKPGLRNGFFSILSIMTNRFFIFVLWIFVNISTGFSVAQEKLPSKPILPSPYSPLIPPNVSVSNYVTPLKLAQNVSGNYAAGIRGTVIPKRTKSDDVAYLCVLVPSDDVWMFSLKRILPAVKMAVSKVDTMEMLPNTELKIVTGNSRCNARDGAIEAFEYYYNRKQVCVP